MFMGRKVSSCGRAAGTNGGCKDQCSLFPGLLQDFWENWLVTARAAGGFRGGLGMVWAGISFQGPVNNCLNPDLSDVCDGHSLRHGLMRRSSLRESACQNWGYTQVTCQ